MRTKNVIKAMSDLLVGTRQGRGPAVGSFCIQRPGSAIKGFIVLGKDPFTDRTCRIREQLPDHCTISIFLGGVLW